MHTLPVISNSSTVNPQYHFPGDNSTTISHFYDYESYCLAKAYNLLSVRLRCYLQAPGNKVDETVTPEQQRILDNSFAKETLSGQFCDQRECCLMAAKGSIKEKAQTVLSNQKRHEVRGKGKKFKRQIVGFTARRPRQWTCH